MKKYYFTTNTLAIIALFLLSAVTAAAASAEKQIENLVARELGAKLRAELAVENVAVKIRALENRPNAAGEVDLRGRATAFVPQDDTELPLEFDAKIDLVRLDVARLNYQFVESLPDSAPSAVKENLMKELMTRFSADYRTTNVVISIDGFDAAEQSTGETAYEGVGEVRIGDLEWNKIKFNVKIDSQSRKVTKILYQFQK